VTLKKFVDYDVEDVWKATVEADMKNLTTKRKSVFFVLNRED